MAACKWIFYQLIKSPLNQLFQTFLFIEEIERGCFGVCQPRFEASDIEAVWFEVYPLKSNLPILFSGLYLRPPYKKDDKCLERNIESVYVLNWETIITEDLNINYLGRTKFNKYHLICSLTGMNFEQLVSSVTRPLSKTRLDHIFTNFLRRIHFVGVRDSGLADHLLAFAVCSYEVKSGLHACSKSCTITYWSMKNFKMSKFLASLIEIPGTLHSFLTL